MNPLFGRRSQSIPRNFNATHQSTPATEATINHDSDINDYIDYSDHLPSSRNTFTYSLSKSSSSVSSCSILFWKLTPEIFGIIISTYLTPNDVSRLDVSVLNKDIRSRCLLPILSSVVWERLQIINDCMARWIGARKLQVRTRK